MAGSVGGYRKTKEASALSRRFLRSEGFLFISLIHLFKKREEGFLIISLDTQ